MDRKTEIKKDLMQILRQVYVISEERETTSKQEEFLTKVVDYLDANISLRRKVVKEKSKQELEPTGYVNPDSLKW